MVQGHRIGQPFKCLPWQRGYLRRVWPSRVRRAPSEMALSCGRGNGKTAWIGALASAALDGPLAVEAGTCSVVASSFDQARITFDFVLRYLRPYIDADPSLYRVQDNFAKAIIERRDTGARVRCIGSDPRRAHGLAGPLVILDEPAQWLPSTSAQMIAAVRTLHGKIPGGRTLGIGTLPPDPGHWFRAMVEQPHSLLYQPADREAAQADPFNEDYWHEANPSLRHFPELRKTLRKEAALAKEDPSILQSFLSLRLNLGVADVQVSSLIEAEAWRRLEGEALPEGPAVWGSTWGPRRPCRR